MRKLALDVGQKRIGIAISDPSLTVATPLTTLIRNEVQGAVDEIKRIAQENDVDEVVVGLPTNMDGTYGRQAEETMNFVEHLKERLDLPIITWDERLTTQMATRLLVEADLSRKKRKGLIDRVAAVFILQSYLESLQRRGDGDAQT